MAGIVTTLKEALAAGMCSMRGHPDGGHTLAEALEQAGTLTGTNKTSGLVIVNKDDRSVEVDGMHIFCFKVPVLFALWRNRRLNFRRFLPIFLLPVPPC